MEEATEQPAAGAAPVPWRAVISTIIDTCANVAEASKIRHYISYWATQAATTADHERKAALRSASASWRAWVRKNSEAGAAKPVPRQQRQKP